MAQTIIAVGSSPGTSSVGLVRISGIETTQLLQTVVDLPDERGVQCVRCTIDGMDLPCVVLWMPGPASYTGEDVAELILPGNPLLLERIVAQLIESGVSAGLAVGAATGGEFTYRAWCSGSLDLAQAESVMQLVTAETDADLHAARSAASGQLHEQTSAMAQSIALILALVEAGIDFTDEEDIVLLPAGTLLERIAALCDQVQGIMGGTRGGETDDERPLVRLLGRPSAGKSTLFNALLGRKRAVTRTTPHTTRDELVEPCQLPDGRWVRLADTPGVASHSHSKTQEAHLQVWCVPVGDALKAQEGLVVRTMSDQGGVGQGELGVSAQEGHGLPALLQAIAETLTQDSVAALRAAVSARQRVLLERVWALLKAAAVQAAYDPPAAAIAAPELAAANLREALDLVGQISGDIPPDEVLGLVFSSFCIGK